MASGSHIARAGALCFPSRTDQSVRRAYQASVREMNVYRAG